jgi:integrase
MPIYRDRERGAFVFEFNRVIPGAGRIRARKRLPKAWNQAQADAFDRKESARLYALASGTEGADHLIEDAVSRYVEERCPNLKTGKATALELAGMYWAYAGRPMSALPDVVKAYKLKARRVDKDGVEHALAPASIRNRIRYLVSACRWGWREHSMGEHDPGAAVTVPQVKNERHVYGSRIDMLRACKACKNRTARMAIRIAFYSGMRLSEILKAKVRGTAWVLEDTKNGNPRIVPIHPRAAVCSRRFKAIPKITIQRAWSRARDAAGLQGMHFHDWRHSAASELINAGVDLYTVGRVLGHKDSRSTQRYAHLAVDTLSAAIGKIGQKNPSIPQKKTA